MVKLSMRARQIDNERGFTLTELATILGIMVVLSALAVPSLSSMLRNNRVKQAASDMVMTLAYARNEAITRNAQVTVVAFGTWGAGWQVVVNGTALRQTLLGGEVTVAGPADNSVTYNPNGRLATLTALKFMFSVPGNTQVLTRCVSAGLMGQPVLQSDTHHDGDCSNG
jgi:type IV fimbrial biogenesis protein FimT